MRSSVPNTELPELFIQWLTFSDRKPRTCKYHARNIRRLLNAGVHPSDSVKIKEYIQNLIEESKSTSYTNGFIDTCRIYYQFCKEEGYPCDENVLTIKRRKDRYKPKATMSDTEIEEFLSLPCPRRTVRHRSGKMFERWDMNPKLYEKWTIFFSVMAYTGMRPGEVANLRVEDIDWSRGVFSVNDSKTNEPRLVPVPDHLIETLQNRSSEVVDGYLFPSDGVSKKKKVVNDVDWHYNFHKRLKRMGLKRANLTPYSLRHSYITEMLQTEGVNLFDVKQIVGHSDTRTTEHYYHLTVKRIVAAAKKHPGVRKHSDPAVIVDAIDDFFNSIEIEKDRRFEVSKKRKGGSYTLSIKWLDNPSKKKRE